MFLVFQVKQLPGTLFARFLVLKIGVNILVGNRNPVCMVSGVKIWCIFFIQVKTNHLRMFLVIQVKQLQGFKSLFARFLVLKFFKFGIKTNDLRMFLVIQVKQLPETLFARILVLKFLKFGIKTNDLLIFLVIYVKQLPKPLFAKILC